MRPGGETSGGATPANTLISDSQQFFCVSLWPHMAVCEKTGVCGLSCAVCAALLQGEAASWRGTWALVRGPAWTSRGHGQQCCRSCWEGWGWGATLLQKSREPCFSLTEAPSSFDLRRAQE